MEFLQLLFSGAGATIIVCLTILTLVGVFLRWPERFSGLSFGWKDAKLEIPKAPQPATPKATFEVAEAPGPKAVTSKEGVRPYIRLMEATESRDRPAIETAIAEMRKDHPAWLPETEVGAFGYYMLLKAGFTDVLDNLKSEERDRPNEVFASTLLARYFTALKAYERAEQHLAVAEKRAKTDAQKTRTWLARAARLEITSGREAADYLVQNSGTISDLGDKARLLEEAGRLYADAGGSAHAMLAYEELLRYAPENVDARFKLALLYGTHKATKLLALRHYEVVLGSRSDYTGAMNNLAVLYGELNVNPRKIALMKRAADTDSHALGNLAHFYIEAGLLDEAQTLLDKDKGKVLDNERALSAKQEVSSERDKAEKETDRLMGEAELLASRVNGFDFSTVPLGALYTGRWETRDKRATLNIEVTDVGGAKLVLSRGGEVRYAHPWTISPMEFLTFSKKESSSRGLIDLGLIDGEEALALFGENKIRIIEAPEGSKTGQLFDFERGA